MKTLRDKIIDRLEWLDSPDMHSAADICGSGAWTAIVDATNDGYLEQLAAGGARREVLRQQAAAMLRQLAEEVLDGEVF